jgi:PAS domain S-box-containing protein
MPQDAKSGRFLIPAVIVVLTAGIFFTDMHTRLGMAVWVGYVIPLLVSSGMRRAWLPFGLAAVFSGMIYAAWVLAPAGIDRSAALNNRILGMVVLWVIAVIEFKRRRVYTQLCEKETRLNTLFKILPAGVSIVDGERKLLEKNPALETLLHLSKARFEDGKMVGRRFLRADGSVLPEDEVPSLRSIRENRVIMDSEMGVVREDGAVIWIAVNAAPLAGVGAVVATIDITKRKLAEQALAESEERYRRLFNEMTEGFAAHEIICDAAGKPCDYRYLEINPAFERLTGLRREKIVGRRLTEVLPDEDPKWLDRYGQVALTGEPVHFESFSPALNRHYEVDAYCPAPGQFAVMFLDVTARKRVEHLLQEQYLELENLYHSLPVGLAVIDRQFRYLRINDHMAAINGRPAVDHLGRTIYEMIPEVASLLEPVYRRVFDTGEPVTNVEYAKNSRPNPAHERNYLASYHPLKTQSGHVYGFCAVVMDISGRKGAEKALAESEERFRSAMQYSGIGMAVCSATGAWLEVNPALTAILGYSREEFLAGDFQSITHPDDLGSCLIELDRLRRGDINTFEVQKRFRHHAGHYLWVQSNVSMIRFGDGRPGYFVVQMQDITERKQAADELFQSREMLRMILDNIPERVFWKDVHSRFLGGNQLFARDCGFISSGELIGKTDFDTAMRDHGEVFQADDRHVMATDRPKLSYEVTQQAPDGRTAFLLASKVPLHDKEGRVIGVLGTYEDITERKALETQFRQAQKMEAVGRLAGGVAHDFNNLLTIISGYSDILLSELPAEDPSRDSLTEIKKASDRAAALTRQLLAFSRNQVLVPDILDLNSVIGECENMFLRLLGEDIEFKKELDPYLGKVQADPSQLDQVLLNLVVNARDAMPQGGVLSIQTGNAILDESFCQSQPGVRPGRYVRLAVSDTGMGMEESVRAQIFEPFFTTKQQGKGTGLGLAMVFGFIKQSGGHVTVSSELGRGSSFTIYLPEVRVSDPADKPSGASREVPPGSETILLVEDQADVRTLARHMLQMRGYQVLEAPNGTDAIRLVENHQGPIDLMVSDVVMPGMGGRQLAEKIVALRPEIKVLFVSGYTDDAVMRHGIHSSETNFLQKPFTGESLAQKVRKVLDQ